MSLATDGRCQNGFAMLEEELHDLAQPLTSMQCSLEIGLLLGDEASARQALQESLMELKRVCMAVSRMRAAIAKIVEGRVPDGI